MVSTISNNQYQFMLRTGKYYPEEDIKLFRELYYFDRLDKNGNCIYHEDSENYWESREFNEYNMTYYEDSTGYWQLYEYDSNGNSTYFETSTGYWEKLKNSVVIDYGKK